MEGRGRMESGGKNEGPTTKGERRKWIGGREGKRKGFDLPDQCQSASYAPVPSLCIEFSRQSASIFPPNISHSCNFPGRRT